MSNEYYDLNTTGVAFINRFRLNKPPQGQPYYSITLAALRGKSDDKGKTQKTYIDCNVVGPAVEMVKEIEPYFADGQKPSIMVKFVSGDLELKPFEYSSGARKGQRGYSLKGRLFDIKWFRVEGKTYYSEAERKRHEEAERKANSQDAPSDTTQSMQQPEEQVAVDQIGSENDEVSLPEQVKLDPADPYFDERKSQLKTQGYRWDGSIGLWCLQAAA